MLLGKSSSKTVPPAPLSEFESGTVLSLFGTVLSLFGGTRGRGWWRSCGATGGEPLPPLASAASRRVGPCTRSVVQRSCTGGPGAARASVTLGLGVPGNLLRRISGVSRRADSERSGPPPAPAATVIIQGPRFQDPGSQSGWRVHEAARLALAGPRRGGPERFDGPVSLPVLLDGRHGPEAPCGVLSVSPHAAARPRHGGPVPLGSVRAGLPGAAAQQPGRLPDGRRRGDRGGHADCLPGDEAAGLARVPPGPDELDPQPALLAAHRRGHPIFRYRAEAGTV